VTRLRDIGEDALVRRLAAITGPAPRGWVGIGDDAAVVRAPGRDVVVTTDALVEGTHFLPGWFSPGDLGWKALAVNLSDVAAMLAVPRAAVVSLVLPADVEVRWVEAVYRGMMRLARRHATAVVGGNLARGSTVSIAVTAFGTPARGGAVLRTGARVGDVVFVTGTPGLAGLGRVALETGRTARSGWMRAGLRRFLAPEPRNALVPGLAGLRPTALIDVSDGLVRDLGRLARSGCAPVVDAARLAPPPGFSRAAAAAGADALDLVLAGGEDYELAFTLSPRAAARLRARGEIAGVPAREIGRMEDAPRGVHLTGDGSRRRLPESGFDHFTRRRGR